MKSLKESSDRYLQELSKRAGQTRISKSYQMIGLEVAGILEDFGHKSLYIKLAKEHDTEQLLSLAKDISTRTNVANKGAYFMKIVTKKYVKS